MTDDSGADAPRLSPGRVIIWIVCLVVVAATGTMPHGVFETASNLLFDNYQRFPPPENNQSKVVVVDIDDESLRRVGQWPWRRDRLARLIDAASGARVVGLDILLTERDRLSPEILIDQWPDLPPAVKAAVSALPQPDAILAKSLAAAPVVLAAAARSDGEEGPVTLVAETPIFEIGSDPRGALPRYRSVAWPLPEHVAAARGVGLVSSLSEPDGIIRRIPVVVAVGSALMPSFAVEVLRVAANAERISLSSDPLGSRDLEIGDRHVVIDTAGRVWPQSRNSGATQSVSAYRVLDGEIAPDLFRDRIVLIGASAAGLGDVLVTPLGNTEPAVIAQAQLIDCMLARDVLWRPPLARFAEIVFALLLTTAALLLLGRVSDRIYTALCGGIGFAAVVGSFLAFRTAGLLLDWTFPLSAFVATMLIAFVLRIGDEARARRSKEEQLRDALLKAEAADRAKTEFLANASHELRTPLTAILGFSEIMADQVLGPVPQRYADYARDIHTTATHLHTLVNDILDLAVIDLGGKQLAEELVDVVGLVTECAHLMPANHGSDDKVTIKTAFAAPLPQLQADPRMVRQMLLNLLSNAVKYSPRGGQVEIRARVADDRGLSITVRDGGPGIAAADIPYAMQPFGRLHSAKLAQEPGIGIGLPLTKAMVELHGGTLTLESVVGIGTEARLWFPPFRLVAQEEAS